ncbi:hypothetical protein ACFPN0_31815 [Kitasatospora cinereorecta]
MTDLDPDQEIVVGIDPRDPAVPALAWAADEAERRALPLRLVLALRRCTTPRTWTRKPRRLALHAQGQEALTAAAQTIARLTPGYA